MNALNYLILAWIAVITFGCSNNSAPAPTVNEAAVKDSVKYLVQGVFDDVWAGLDSTAIERYHTDDFIILEHGEVWTNDTIKKYIRGALERGSDLKRINRMEYIDMKIVPGMAYASYDNYADFVRNDSIILKRRWLESVTAIPTADGWRLNTMHSTRAPMPQK